MKVMTRASIALAAPGVIVVAVLTALSPAGAQGPAPMPGIPDRLANCRNLAPGDPATRQCARRALSDIGRDLKAEAGQPFSTASRIRFEALATRFNEAMNASMTLGDDPQRVLREALPGNAAPSVATPPASSAERPTRQRLRRSTQVAQGKCSTQAGTIPGYQGNTRPHGRGLATCTVPAANAVGLSVKLNRYSGNWYEDNSFSNVFPGSTAAVVTASNNRCGYYYANTFARWAPRPGWTIVPDFHASNSTATYYC